MEKSDESVSDFSNFILEATEEDKEEYRNLNNYKMLSYTEINNEKECRIEESSTEKYRRIESDIEKQLSSTKTVDNNNYYENSAVPSTTRVQNTEKSVVVFESAVKKLKPRADIQKELAHEEQNYKKLQARIQELMRKENKLRNKKDFNPLYWCMIGAEYSDCCGIILKTISEDLSHLSPPKNIDEKQDLEAIKRKYRVMKAYDLLFILNDCFKRIYCKINEFYNQHTKSRYHYTHLAPSIQGYEGKAKLIEEYIDMLKQYVNTMFEMKHGEWFYSNYDI